MTLQSLFPATALAVFLAAGLATAAAAAPLVLYDPGTATPPPGSLLPSTTTIAGNQPGVSCGLTAPCANLNAAPYPSTSPLGSSFSYGMSGEASGTVSNHGQGGELGVLGWLKTGDTTLSLAVTVGTGRFDSRRFTIVPVGPRP